jgi:hypothetical protein
VGDRGDIGAGNVELSDAEQGLFRRGQLAAAALGNAGDQQHVGTVDVHLEPLGQVVAQDRRCERTERFAVLDLEVEHRLHLGRGGLGEN